jgi:hypothetical protein
LALVLAAKPVKPDALRPPLAIDKSLKQNLLLNFFK